MIAEAWACDVDLLAAEHVAEARPDEQRAVRVLVLAAARLDPLVDAEDEATPIVDVRILIDVNYGLWVVTIRKHFEEFGAVSSIEANLF